MQIYQDARNSSSKRFCKPHRMMLIQADIKYGPKLPIGRNGAKVQTYLSSAIEDHSRYLLSSRFYDNQEEAIIEDTFHQVIDAFIRESKLKNIKTLEKLNRLWAIYLDEYYHKKKHDGIAEYYESLGAAVPEKGISPL